MNILKIFNKKQKPEAQDKTRAIALIVPQNMQRTLGIDLKVWWDAIIKTMDVYYPQWYQLQEVLTKMTFDARLYGVMDKRRLSMLNLDLVYKDAQGNAIEDVCKFIKQPIFRKMLSDIFDAKFYGYTVLQLFNDSNALKYDMYPRTNVNPKRKELLKNKFDFTGENIESFDNMIFFGNESGLGILAIVAKNAILKTNSIADYSQYIERYGMGIEKITYEGNDPSARDQVSKGLDNLGSNGRIEVPQGMNVEVMSPANSSSNDVFDRFVTLQNEEMTIAILGQLMTTEKGANYQAEVQSNVEESIFSADRAWMLDELNTKVKGTLIKLFNIQDGTFMFEETERKDKKALIEEDTLLNQLIPIDKASLYEKYGVTPPAV